MQPETYYHIYNHANGNENLFRSNENYHFFLRQWAKYIEPMAETYAYCLMPNHIHFLIRTQTSKVFENLGGLNSKPANKTISQAFSNLFNSYTKAFNKMHSRKGSLFIPNFKRKAITNDAYLTTVVAYIHRNPIHHGFCIHLEDWQHSSYPTYLTDRKTKVKREFMLDWFCGKEKFIQYHREQSFLPDQSLFIDF
ncbi:MAG: transposase [Reichenbachiella sp.]|uniref:transposase n=1 Tax=Reichenbachiella sp. TaxID=2184521 RepID=UPI00329A3992